MSAASKNNKAPIMQQTVALGKALSRKLDANGTDGLWKDIYDVSTDTTLTSQHECWYASRELNQYTGEEARADRKT